MPTFTAFCSFPETPRGVYDEEIDVEARNPARAMKSVKALIATGTEYDFRLHVRRVVRSHPAVTIYSWSP